ncbi:MAG: DUF4445 domain-containing protein [Bacteroidales bacterium]|nr:DUF4445 domain-containing protein [Bacteroidales bacterium]
MPLITFLPSEKTVDVKAGTEISDAARYAGVDIAAPCGGEGTCGKCIIEIKSGNADFSSITIDKKYNLACKTKVLDEPLTIFVPEPIESKNGKFSDSLSDIDLIDPALLPDENNRKPVISFYEVNVPLPQNEDGLSDLDRLFRSLKDTGITETIQMPLSLLRSLTNIIREKEGHINLTLSLKRNENIQKIITIEPGKKTSSKYGLAIDIGTTTIAVQLVLLPAGKIISTKTEYNKQVKCGLDIISRINYALKPERLEELHRLVLETINTLISDICSTHKINKQNIIDNVISGNTTMIHLLLGLIPEYIRLEPYTPTLLHASHYCAGDLKLNINPEGLTWLSPAVGSYVGGDITSGILCTKLATDTDQLNLFIDIGTNGEIVLGNHDFIMTCACSAGPAFEGGGIKFGMRAASGAIENVNIDPETGKPDCLVIGNTSPAGICGTGMISLLANLLKTDWIDPNGKFNREKHSDHIKTEGKQAFFILANDDDPDKIICISEQEIDNIIRAKAAIYSACSLMLKQVELTFNDLESIYIAGGFGRFLNIENAKTIGLIPDLPKEKFKYIGNSSLMGSYMLLVSQSFRERQSQLANKMTYIDLGLDPDYMNQYSAALFLPHTDSGLFPNVMSNINK